MGEDGPGRGHVCHIDTFLVPNILDERGKLVEQKIIFMNSAR